MELTRPEPSTLLDVLPLLQSALGLTLQRLQARHERIFESLGMANVVERARARLMMASPREREDSVVDDVTAVAKELQLALASQESLSASLARMKIEGEEWEDCFKALFLCSVCLLLVPDWTDDEEAKQYIACLLQGLFPAVARTWLALNELNLGCFHPDLPRQLWSLVAEIIFEEATPRGMRLGMATSIIARCLRLFQPWLSEERPHIRLLEAMQFDLRAESRFPSLIRAGLLDNEGATRKQSLFILKQTVKFCTFYMQPEEEAARCGQGECRVFFWRPVDRERWSEAWRRFFLLYESIQETQVHIVEPMLPLLKTLIADATSLLDRFWWDIILYRAIAGDSGHVRRLIIQTVMEMDVGSMPRLMEARDLLFGALLEAIDSTALFQTDVEEGTMVVSPFGMTVARFYATYLMAVDANVRGAEIEYFLSQVAATVRSATPALFLLQSLLQLPRQPVLGSQGVAWLCTFSRNTVLFHNVKARRLARWQLLYAFLGLADAAALSFTEIATALHEFLREDDQLNVQGREYRDICSWLQHHFGSDYVDQNISLRVQEYFVAAMSGEAVQTMAAEISTLLVFSLSREGGFAQSIRPLYQQMAVISRVDTEPTYIVAGVTLFVMLDKRVRSVTGGRTDVLSSVDVGARLYEWIAAIEGLLLHDTLEMLPNLQATTMLLAGMRLFLDKASEQPNVLITYLNILLYRLVDLVNCFAQQAARDRAEGYLLQLQKMIVFELMAIAFAVLERIGTFHLGFCDPMSLQNVFSCELEKPPRMTDEQAEDWDALIIAFSVSRWTLISVIARFSRQSPELADLVDLDEIFHRCLLALESAKYKSVIAIFDCLRILASLSTEIPLTTISQAITLAQRVLEEAADTPVWLYLYAEAFIDFFVQPALLNREEVSGGTDSLAGRVLHYLIHELGRTRKNIVPRLARNLRTFWGSPAGHASRLALLAFFIELLLYGPAREESEDRLAQALARTHTSVRSQEERGAAVDTVAASSDYLVRTSMNSVILHLDPLVDEDSKFARTLFDDLLDVVVSN